MDVDVLHMSTLRENSLPRKDKHVCLCLCLCLHVFVCGVDEGRCVDVDMDVDVDVVPLSAPYRPVE